MNTKHGYLVISLDFELFWGMSDVTTIEAYGENVLGERTAIPRMLDLFKEYGIHASWATVGMLMARNKDELLSLLPPRDLRPTYTDMRLSSYHHLLHDGVGADEASDQYHFGPSLIEEILRIPHQEIENHTFSHYYAVDGHQNSDSIFERDLIAHAQIAKTYGITTSAIVFPRNQTTEGALRVCRDAGITSYRGTEDHFLYRSRGSDQPLWMRALRLLDHYINLSGYHTYPLPTASPLPINIPSSRFLRPYMKTLSFLEPLRLFRIKRAMTHAAKRGEVFHLWWHPHNFGIHQDQNFKNLTALLEHFALLQKKYGFESASMKEIADLASTT
jgi:peptidoglycan/xylan/chitin deacetylase (PgdA/CDA1 family)